MRPRTGIEIESILSDSPAKKSGLRSGDILLSVNSHPLSDVIDFIFHKSTDKLDIVLKRSGAYKKVQILKDEESDLGITIKPFKVKVCKNNCIFCFVKQLPKGLRKSLYIKDEDYRLSFLYGNYITISNLDSTERKKIIDQRLSPLYISVHTTNKTLRNKMLGNSRASDILKELRYFCDRKIRMHTQIVLCPGYNDGKELKMTIRDLYKFYPYTSSVAVVPVGLTKHCKADIKPVSSEDAVKTIETVESFQRRFKKKHGDPFVYCSDEMYIKADLPFPGLLEYSDLPQLENGVGMVSLFISRSRKIRIPKSISRRKRFLTFTGASFYPFLKKFINRLIDKEKINIDLVPVENKFFGNSVTVTGLLTGRDIIRTLHDHTNSYDFLIVPEATLNEDRNLFLDDVLLEDLEEAFGIKAIVTDGTPQGFINTISNKGGVQ